MPFMSPLSFKDIDGNSSLTTRLLLEGMDITPFYVCSHANIFSYSVFLVEEVSLILRGHF